MAIPDELIRQRSYEIWQCAGCPHGLAVEHWFRAKAELEAELSRIPSRAARFPILEGHPGERVVPRPLITYPPRKLVAQRLQEQDRSQAA